MKRPKNLDELPVEEQLAWYKSSFEELYQESASRRFTPEVERLFKDIYNIIIDPNNFYYPKTKDKLIKDLESLMGNKVAVIYNEGVTGKGRDFDVVLEQFAMGTGGYLSDWDREKDTDSTLIIRGIGGTSREAIRYCWDTGRDYLTIDTGYLGNEQFKTKVFHRVTKNNLQHLGPIIERPTDRLTALKYKFRKFRPGKKVLICPPSEKVMLLWDQPDPRTWTEQVIEQLKEYTDRPIEVRLKPNRTERTTSMRIQDALADDVHCLITYNSIAATEAILWGKPAIALGPNAAQVICNTKLEDVENLHIPLEEEVVAFAAHLSYCQFSVTELKDGTAWRILNEGS